MRFKLGWKDLKKKEKIFIPEIWTTAQRGATKKVQMQKSEYKSPVEKGGITNS